MEDDGGPNGIMPVAPSTPIGLFACVLGKTAASDVSAAVGAGGTLLWVLEKEMCRRKLGYPFKVIGHWGATAACLRECARARRPHCPQQIQVARSPSCCF